MMGKLTSGEEAASGAPSGERLLTTSALFNQLWETLADVLGTAATAMLIRRAARRAAARDPRLHELVVQREALGYTCVVPEAWREPGSAEPAAALQELARELRPLLVELTGVVVIQRLQRVPALRALELGSPSKEQP